MNEAEIIARLFSPRVGVGAHRLLDDGAMLPPLPRGTAYGVTCDSLVEGIHTLPDTSPEHWAYKAIAVNLSDLAAMAAKPLGIVVSLAVPRQRVQKFCAPFARAFARQCTRYDLSWLGGDLTRIEGPLSICATVFGAVDPKRQPLRTRARAEDGLFVTGSLGESTLGLQVLQGSIQVKNSAYVRSAIRRYRCPEARVQAGLNMRPYVHAAMDISDGLVADLPKLCRASRLGAEVDLRKLPIASGMRDLIGEERALRFAVGGGEDFELLLTLPTERAQRLRKAIAPLPLSQIGVLTKRRGIRYTNSEPLGQGWQKEIQGYSHFP